MNFIRPIGIVEKKSPSFRPDPDVHVFLLFTTLVHTIINLVPKHQSIHVDPIRMCVPSFHHSGAYDNQPCTKSFTCRDEHNFTLHHRIYDYITSTVTITHARLKTPHAINGVISCIGKYHPHSGTCI